MADDLTRYRENYPVEKEDAYVKDACKDKCGGTTVVSPCAPFLPSSSSAGLARLMFKSPLPRGGVTRFDRTPKERDFRCWSVLPELRMDVSPSDIRPQAEMEATLNMECFRCRNDARLRYVLGGMVTPDARFWIGAALAGTGLLLATVKFMTRK
jgi:hypothetical protein